MSLIEAFDRGVSDGLYGFVLCLTFVGACIFTMLLVGLFARLIGGKPDKEEDDE